MDAPQPIDRDAFRHALGHYPTGVAVVTGLDSAGGPVGMVVGSFTSVSLDPPLVAFLPRVDSKSFATLRPSDTFCVNVLAFDQEAICRKFAVSGADKFDGVGWRPGPGGAPILDDVVCWIECRWEEVTRAGDHYIVLGSVTDLAVERAGLPLLFFQGGYGRFSLPSLTTADPHLIEAAMSAERIRSHIERCSGELGVECAVLAKVGEEIVTVLSARGARLGGRSSVGERVPHIAPLGSVFLREADQEEVQRWMGHLEGASSETASHIERNLARIEDTGYSVTLASDHGDTLRALTAEYSSNATPADARRLRTVIAESIDQYEPVINPDEVYDLESIAVPLDTPTDLPRLAVRILDLPPRTTGATVQSWIEVLTGTAASASRRLATG